MDVNSLISALSSAKSTLPAVQADYCKTHSIHSSPSTLNFYVEPALDGPESISPIILISAPAAVGKTTLAHYIHQKLTIAGQGALYIPLQEASIGNDFFTGRLAGVFPELSKRQILDAVFRGEIILLFDGYDEVTMRSDQIDRNKKFIAEIKSELEDYEQRCEKARPCIAFLFRSVFADFGVFDDIKNLATEISVLFFDAALRKKFLTEYLNSKSEEKPLKGHLSGDFLDGFEDSLDTAKEDQSAFFGHAIVLSAFGDYLHEQDETNAIRLVSSLKDEETLESVAVTLLTKIINLILEREEQKFPVKDYALYMPNFAPYSSQVQEQLLLGIAADDFLRKADRPLFYFENAINSLLHEFETHIEFSALDENTQEQLRSDYRNEIERRITHHPFLEARSTLVGTGIATDKIEFRNPVYREYYFARVILKNTTTAWALDAVRNDYSHYLALFFLASVENRDITKHESFLFSLISLFATSSSGSGVYFKLQWAQDKACWEGTIDMPKLQVKPFFISDPLLTIEIPPQGVLQDAIFIGSGECIIEISGPPPTSGDTKIELTDCTFSAPEVTFSVYAAKFSDCDIICEKLHFSDQVGLLEGLNTLTIHNQNGKDLEITASEHVKTRWGAALRKLRSTFRHQAAS